MIRSIGAILFAGFLLLPVTGASEPAPADPALSLLKRSGLYEQLGTLAASVEQQLETQHAQMPLATRAALVKAMREAYAADSLREAARTRLARRIDPKLLREVDVWLASPLGRGITRLEEQASTPEATRKLQAYAASLQMTPPSVDRISLIQDVDRLSGSSELATDVALQTAGAVARGMSAAKPGSPSRAEIDRAIAAQRPSMRAAMEQSTLVGLLYTYQSLSAAELSSYISFLGSPAGRWYREVTSEAMVAALDQANARLEARLAGAPRAGSRPAANSY